MPEYEINQIDQLFLKEMDIIMLMEINKYLMVIQILNSTKNEKNILIKQI